MTPELACCLNDSDTVMLLDVVRLTGDEGREATKGLVDAREMLFIPESREGVSGVFASERARWRREGVLGVLGCPYMGAEKVSSAKRTTRTGPCQFQHVTAISSRASLMSLLFKHLRIHQVFGANTDVGKTILTTALVRASALANRNANVFYLKPVSTGPIEDADDKSDHLLQITVLASFN